jgi:3-hydroxyisobutyrate dehydrogenase
MLRMTSRAMRTFSTGKRVGFFGLGNMGLPMATNLQKNGWEVKGYDISEAGCARAEEMGIKATQDFVNTAKDVDYIVSALPITKNVDDTLYREGGIFEVASKGTMICDASTIDPNASVRFAADAKAKGMTFLDAPMSGGIMGAQNGTLTFMLGCENEDFEKAKTVLLGCGKNVFHCGAPGTGGIAKLTNNLILGISMVAVSEAMAIGEKLGADPKVLTDIWAVSFARSFCVDTYNPRPGVQPNVPSSKEYEGGFAVELIRKDLGLAMDAAKSVGADMDFTERSFNVYADIEKAGFARKDFSFVYQYLMNNREMKNSGW